MDAIKKRCLSFSLGHCPTLPPRDAIHLFPPLLPLPPTHPPIHSPCAPAAPRPPSPPHCWRPSRAPCVRPWSRRVRTTLSPPATGTEAASCHERAQRKTRLQPIQRWLRSEAPSRLKWKQRTRLGRVVGLPGRGMDDDAEQEEEDAALRSGKIRTLAVVVVRWEVWGSVAKACTYMLQGKTRCCSSNKEQIALPLRAAPASSRSRAGNPSPLLRCVLRWHFILSRP